MTQRATSSELAARLREVGRAFDLGEALMAELTALVDLGETAPPGRPLPEGFEDRGPLGVGGMGEVRRVRDLPLDRDVALKALLPQVGAARGAVARFIHEAQAGAQLEHPGIPSVHTLGRLPDGRIYFTMREVEGQSLEALIDDLHGHLPGGAWLPAPSGASLEGLLDVLRRVCETVAYAHSRGVWHRDLKPANIMVGAFGEVMVLDWGLAAVRGISLLSAQEGVVTGRSQSPALASAYGAVMGTPSYMPPEQALGRGVGPQADVYALGAILYHILTGRPPYQGPDAASVLLKLISGPPPPPLRALGWAPTESETLVATGPPPMAEGPSPFPGAEGPLIAPELREICERAMRREPSERFEGPWALRQALADWQDGAHRRARALQRVDEAIALRRAAEALSDRASRMSEEALARLEGVQTWAPIEAKLPVWRLQDEAQQAARDEEAGHARAEQVLWQALAVDPDLPEAHRALADGALRNHTLAEARGDTAAAAAAAVAMCRHDPIRFIDYLEGEGALTVVTDPPGARVEVLRYERINRRLIPRSLGIVGHAPLFNLSLAQGSYLLILTAPGCEPVRYPVRIGRQGGWSGIPPGEEAPMAIPLPPRGTLGPMDHYIPPGPFRCGGDPEAIFGMAASEPWVSGFILRRFPVTNGERQALLNALVDQGREDLALELAPRALSASTGAEGAIPLARDARGHFLAPADADWAADRAAVWLTPGQADAYAAVVAAEEGLPWRLPGEIEWEKAARGVDGRLFPWGDHLDPTWACTLGSHPGVPTRPPVDAFPVDESPYGVRGMCGGAKDWCQDAWMPRGPLIVNGRSQPRPGADERRRVSRGGACYGPPRLARLAGRGGALTTSRSSFHGFRLARSWPPRIEEEGP